MLCCIQHDADIIDDHLRRAAAIPLIDSQSADNIDGLREVGKKWAEAEADDAERSEGSSEMFAGVSDESRFVEQDVLKEEPWFGISLTERFEFLEALTEVERDGRGMEDGVNGDSRDKIFGCDILRDVFLESGNEFFEILPRESASCGLYMAAEACEEVG
jgi:hypothetical protein